MYQWKFTTEIGQIVAEEFTIGNQFFLGQTSAIENNMNLVVAVKVLVNDVWGPYGEVCTVQTEQSLGTTALSSADCESTITEWNHTITATEIASAVEYEWHVVGVNFDNILVTNIPMLQLNDQMSFVNGQTYSVTLRCNMGNDVFTDWGTSCNVTFAVGVGIGEIASDGDLTFYPNPCDGNKITFDFGNLSSGSHVKDLKIFGSTGNLVEITTIVIATSQTDKTEYKFQHPLSSGVYVIQYTLNGRLREEKLIVR